MRETPVGSPSGGRDWSEIRRRLELIDRADAGAGEASPERVREVLEARARALARPVGAQPDRDTFGAVLFELAGETYAVAARWVWEVFRLTVLAPLPGATPPVFGVTSWRGALVTVLDLRQVLGLPVGDVTDLGRVILLGAERPAFGVLADAVRELVVLRRTDVREPAEGVATRREYLEGITGDTVLVLAGSELLRRHGGSALHPAPAPPGG